MVRGLLQIIVSFLSNIPTDITVNCEERVTIIFNLNVTSKVFIEMSTVEFAFNLGSANSPFFTAIAETPGNYKKGSKLSSRTETGLGSSKAFSVLGWMTPIEPTFSPQRKISALRPGK